MTNKFFRTETITEQKKDKHPERKHTIWGKKFYVYKNGQIEHRSARADWSFWKYIRDTEDLKELQVLFGKLKRDIKNIKYYTPEWYTLRRRIKIVGDTYDFYKFIQSNKDSPTNIVLEGIDGELVTVTMNPPSKDKKDYTGFMGAVGYITTKGEIIGEVGLRIRSVDKGREAITKWLTRWHKTEDYPNPNLIERNVIALENEIESRKCDPDVKSNYWKWRYDKNRDKDSSNGKKKDKQHNT